MDRPSVQVGQSVELGFDQLHASSTCIVAWSFPEIAASVIQIETHVEVPLEKVRSFVIILMEVG